MTKENWERKKKQAWLLRAEGKTYKEIGKQLGGVSRSRAYQLVGRFNRQLDRMIEPERDQAQGDAQVTAAFSQAKREQVARAICCPQGCQYLGDSEDGNTCYCDTSDLRGSKIERATDAVLAALSALERGGWQPIETAPKQIVRTFGENEYGESILLYAGEIIRGRWWQDARASWRNEGYQNFVIDGGRAVHPTHWMPLPAPPSIVAEK